MVYEPTTRPLPSADSSRVWPPPSSPYASYLKPYGIGELMLSRRSSWVGCVTVSENPIDSSAAAMRSWDSRTTLSDAIGLSVENMAKPPSIRVLLRRSPQVVSVMKREKNELT